MIAKFKQYLLLLLKPYTGLIYFHEYYRLIEQAHNNPHVYSAIRLYNSLLLVKALHFLYLGILSSGSILQTIAHFDGLYMFLTKKQFNLLAFACAIMVWYFNYRLLLKPDFQLVGLLRRVLLAQEVHFFAINSKQNARVLCRQIQHFYLSVLNGFLSIIASMELVFVYGYCFSLYNFFIHRRHFGSIPHFLFSILQSQLLGLFFGFYLLNFGHVMALNFSSNAAFLALFKRKIRLVSLRFAQLVPQFHLHRLGFSRFWHEFTQTLVFFFRVNHTHGKLFFAYLVAFSPINVVFTMWLVDTANGLTRLSLYFWVAYFYFFLLVIHLSLAYCTKHIHRPGQLLLHIAAHDQNANLRFKLKLLRSIAVLCTANRYGFTYGECGLVSLATFSKYLMLYGKFFMISYKLMRMRVI